MAHGGPRTPSSPAPVSGPGALSARTDGGPAKGLVPPAQAHGARTATEQQLAVSPEPGSPGTVTGGPAPAPITEALPGMELPDPFAPTDRPGESPGALPGPPAMDTNQLVQYLYSLHPDPWLLNLIRDPE